MAGASIKAAQVEHLALLWGGPLASGCQARGQLPHLAWMLLCAAATASA